MSGRRDTDAGGVYFVHGMGWDARDRWRGKSLHEYINISIYINKREKAAKIVAVDPKLEGRDTMKGSKRVRIDQ